MSDAKVFKLTGIAVKSEMLSCSSVEPDAWVSFADHMAVVDAMKESNERLKVNLYSEKNAGWDAVAEAGVLKEKLEAYRKVVALLNSHIDKLTHAGNRLSIRTGQFACAKHYQPELKAWADAISEGKPPSE